MPIIKHPFRYCNVILYGFAIFILSACNQSDSGNIALGTIERERIALTATADEIIIDIPAKEGDQVKKGQLLVQLDSREQQAILQKAAADIAEKKATLTKLQRGARSEDVESARAKLRDNQAKLTFASETLRRYTQLLKEKTVSQSTYDKALTSRNAARANTEKARQELLKLTNGTRPEDLDVAVAQLDAANAVYNVEKQRLSNLSVVATRDGILDNLPWNLGERVSKGTPVAVLLSDAAPFVYTYIPETHRAKISEGQSLKVTVDGLDQALTGSVKWIADAPAYTPYYALNAEERTRLVYLAEITLADNAFKLPSGLPAQVQLP